LVGDGVGGGVGAGVPAIPEVHPKFLGISPEKRYAGGFLFPSMRRTSFKLCKSASGPDEMWPASAVQYRCRGWLSR
jgi:hypothetical protein